MAGARRIRLPLLLPLALLAPVLSCGGGGAPAADAAAVNAQVLAAPRPGGSTAWSIITPRPVRGTGT